MFWNQKSSPSPSSSLLLLVSSRKQQKQQNSSVFRTPVVVQAIIFFVFFLFLFNNNIVFVNGYPVLIQVDEESERCLRFNIPASEDAHMVAVILPSDEEMNEEYETIEAYYVDQVYQLTKLRKERRDLLQKTLPTKNSDLPDKVSQERINYIKANNGNTDSKLKMKITGTPVTNPEKYVYVTDTKYFEPSVLNNIARTIDGRTPGRHHTTKKNNEDLPPGMAADMENLEGYGICFDNKDPEKQIQVIFDMVYMNEIITENGSIMNGGGFQKDKHLTPLELSLEQSITAANTVLREMNYMEKREQRMRKTAESINTRVRWFSYLSVSILLSVTYIQVTYLKRYFHKKKLM